MRRLESLPNILELFATGSLFLVSPEIPLRAVESVCRSDLSASSFFEAPSRHVSMS